MRGQPQVVVANGQTLLLQGGANLAVMLTRFQGQGAGGYDLCELFDGAQGALAGLAFFCTKMGGVALGVALKHPCIFSMSMLKMQG